MSERFNFIETPLSGLYLIQKKPISDNRGFFNRLFCSDEFKEIGFNKSIVQMNTSFTKKKGTVRGMHYQYPPYTETKIITCLKGEVFDVAVDLRKDSPTFLQWHGHILSEKDLYSYYIPDGFAHGFQTLTDNCELLYMHSSSYQQDAEAAINVLDPKINIAWPLTISDISERDNSHPMIETSFEGIQV